MREPDAAGPPQDLDAEAAVISTLLLDPDRIDEVREILTPEQMYSDPNRRIIEEIYSLHDNGKMVDVTTVTSGLRDKQRLTQIGGTPYIAQIVDATPGVAHVSDHAKIVHNKWRARSAINIARVAAASIGSGTTEEMQSSIEEAEQGFSDLSHADAKPKLREFREVLKAAHKQMNIASASPTHLVGVTTGFADLDTATTGYEAGDLIVVAGRPGMGKTAFEFESCVRTAKATGEAVAFFSLEQPAIQLALRAISSESRVPLKNIRRAMMGPSEWSAVTAAIDVLGRVPLFIDDTPDITIFDVKSRLRRLTSSIKAGDHPGVTRVCRASVDYLQLMGSVLRGASREERVSDTTRRAKNLAKELEIPLTLLSQLNRSVEQRVDRRPELADLRESGAIEQDADKVMFLFRDEYYTKDKTVWPGVAELIIAKQRSGPTGTYKLKFTAEYVRFDDLARDEYSYDHDADDDFDD